jgi:glutamate 5-kinase
MSADINRKELFRKVNRMVVKVGTNVIADNAAGIDRGKIESLSRQVGALKKEGREVIIVSSGAITAGIRALGMKSKPKTIPEEQAAAAVGQGIVMSCYSECFKLLGINTAQILLTQADLRDRKRYINARNTIMALLRKGVVPIVNENDTVAVDELVFGERFGDNDIISAMVAILSESRLLIMLTSVDGLFEGKDQVIDVVEKVTDKIKGYARTEKSVFGKGGMQSKIRAAKIMADSGEIAVIANGQKDSIVEDLLAGAVTGTVFLPNKHRTESRKRWIAYTLNSKGKLTIDKGAVNAIMKGKSLLPGGIISCRGDFQKGDAVTIEDNYGGEVARGLSNYSSAEVLKIKGIKTSEIENVLGKKPYDEIIHRDNMALLRK